MIYYIYYRSASSEQENKKVKDFIKTFHGWALLGPSFYLVFKKDAKDGDIDTNLLYIKSKLKEYGFVNDEFFIGQMGSEATWQGYGIPLKNWLIKYSRPINEDDNNFSLKDRIEAAKKAAQANEKSASSQDTEGEDL